MDKTLDILICTIITIVLIITIINVFNQPPTICTRYEETPTTQCHTYKILGYHTNCKTTIQKICVEKIIQNN